MTNLTYKQIAERCANAAAEVLPALPTEGTQEAWQDYYDELDDFDVYDAAWQEVDSWDWSIYTHYGMQIVQLATSEELNAAEAQWLELDGPSTIDASFGVYELASKVAYFILLQMVTEAIEALIEEMKDLADMEIKNREGVEA